MLMIIGWEEWKQEERENDTTLACICECDNLPEIEWAKASAAFDSLMQVQDAVEPDRSVEPTGDGAPNCEVE